MKHPFRDLFIYDLKLAYNSNQLMMGVLEDLINTADNADLKKIFAEHLKNIKKHDEYFESISKDLEENLKKTTPCKGVKGLIEEIETINDRKMPSAVADAALIGIMQKIVHYFIAFYGTLKTYANHLKYAEVERYLQECLDDKIKANEDLTNIAEGSFFWKGINVTAASEKPEKK